MAGIAGIVNWDGAPVDRETLLCMLAAARHRGPDGTEAEIRGDVGFGHLRFLLRKGEAASPQPVWSPDGTLAVAGDIRLYDRRELSRALGAPTVNGPQPNDAELVLAAFERWGPDAVQALNGDFAFAIWDGHRRRLLAFRDPFGVKPLFYAVDPARIRFASEVSQLLVPEGPPAGANSETFARLLATGWPEAREQTFFSGITRLLPGHVLEATAAGVSTSRWWRPTAGDAPARLARDEDYVERFGELLRQAVARRLTVDVPAGLELSGGFDSSAIVLLAADVAGTDQRVPELVTVSQQYPGMSCDESRFISAVLERWPFASIRYDAPYNDYATSLDEEIGKICAPCPDMAWLRRREGSTLLRQRGCRVLLTGLGGDEVVWDPDYELDLLHSEGLVRAVRYCLQDDRVKRGSEQAACLRRLVLSRVPWPLRKQLRAWKHDRAGSVPGWLRIPAPEPDPDEAAGTGDMNGQFVSVSQTTVYRWLNDPSFRWLLESEELLTAHHGLELRHPFLDRDVVEFVLSIPWGVRYRQPGAFKTLLVSALGQRLPGTLRAREGKTTFDDYFHALESRGADTLEQRIFGTDRWDSGHLVDRAALEALRPTMRQPALAGSQAARAYWHAVMTEAWFRIVPRLAGSTAGSRLEGRAPAIET